MFKGFDIQKEKPNAKIGVLYQNDDFGKGLPEGCEGWAWRQEVVGSRMFVFDENGLTRSDGFLDHTTTKLGR